MNRFFRAVSALVAMMLVVSMASCAWLKPPSKDPASSSEPAASSSSQTSSVLDEDTPEWAAHEALDAVHALDMERLSKAITMEQLNEDNRQRMDKMSEEDQKRLAPLVANLTYSVGSATIEGDMATIPAQITNTDYSGVVAKALASLTAYMLQNASAAAEEQSRGALEILEAAIGEANQGEMVTKSVTIHLVREDGAWKVMADEELLDALLGGLVGSLSGIAGQLDSLASLIK